MRIGIYLKLVACKTGSEELPVSTSSAVDCPYDYNEATHKDTLHHRALSSRKPHLKYVEYTARSCSQSIPSITELLDLLRVFYAR